VVRLFCLIKIKDKVKKMKEIEGLYLDELLKRAQEESIDERGKRIVSLIKSNTVELNQAVGRKMSAQKVLDRETKNIEWWGSCPNCGRLRRENEELRESIRKVGADKMKVWKQVVISVGLMLNIVVLPMVIYRLGSYFFGVTEIIKENGDRVPYVTFETGWIVAWYIIGAIVSFVVWCISLSSYYESGKSWLINDAPKAKKKEYVEGDWK
jgi:hypothetical protein